MEVRVIASGSSGNCYLISDKETSLLLECGIPLKEIEAALDYKLTETVSACLVSHEHKDHSKVAIDLAKRGIDVYMTEGTFKALEIRPSHRFHLFSHAFQAEDGSEYYPYYELEVVGTFQIMPFETRHDAAEPVGFMIDSICDGERMVFMTDSSYCPFRFNDVDHFLIEINYCGDKLRVNFENESLNRNLRNRIILNHMSLENAVEFLKASHVDKAMDITAIHLSNTNSDENEIREILQREFPLQEIRIC